MMSKTEVQEHSQLAFEVWKDLWANNAKEVKDLIKTNHEQVLGCYKNKTACLFSYGPSFKKNVEEFKNSELFNNPEVVIGCVDKAFRPIVELGIQPDFVIVADGSVKADWVYGVSDEAIKKTILISNVYANPEWPKLWAKISDPTKILWYLNRDNIDTADRNIENTHKNVYGSAEYFAPFCEYFEVIEAASNVGNSLVVFTRKIFGCYTIKLYGYDYCWKPNTTYYGACDDSKRTFLPSQREIDINNDIVCTTPNMEFSSKWLNQYIQYSWIKFRTKIINMTGMGLVQKGSFT
jgi:hypothetical protein